MIDLDELSPEGRKKVEEHIGTLIDEGQKKVRANIHNHVPAVRKALLHVVFNPGSEARITLKTLQEALYYQAWIESMLEGLFALDKERSSFCQLELINESCILLAMEGETDEGGKADSESQEAEAPNATSKAGR
jgi:hypothetical protein